MKHLKELKTIPLNTYYCEGWKVIITAFVLAHLMYDFTLPIFLWVSGLIGVDVSMLLFGVVFLVVAPPVAGLVFLVINAIPKDLYSE